mmetsp:Transcript_394/g.417  ORF Transcript_394/g.417 Transcript_394/m.417 type:complete len:88 (+) Transcript_394:7-270(+)
MICISKENSVFETTYFIGEDIFLGDPFFFREPFLLFGLPFEGDVLAGDLIGELSFISLPTQVFCTATFSESFFKGLFLSSFSISRGV